MVYKMSKDIQDTTLGYILYIKEQESTTNEWPRQ